MDGALVAHTVMQALETHDGSGCEPLELLVDIAAWLVIAQRTAAGDVAGIPAELGFTTRTQLAAWGAEQRETKDL